MNIIDESFAKPTKKDNSKKIKIIILSTIFLLIIAILVVFTMIMYMQEKELKLYIDGVQKDKVKEMMVIQDNGVIYFPIKDIAPYLSYESFSGEYSNKSESANKCYIKNSDEIANFALNSNKIYKLTISKDDANYEYFYAKYPVKAINGKLYATTDAIEKAFNISFSYNEEKQRVNIYTMPYLIGVYEPKILDYGYEKIDEDFTNRKTILNDMIIVTKDQDKVYGVIDIKGNAIIEPKYDHIQFLPTTGDFLVESNKKVGIIATNREMKVQILYDSLTQIDSDTGLYLAQRDKKYGVIDSRGNIKIYIEFDQIGIDPSRFDQNDIKNQYLLDNGMILARKDNLWGAFNKNGKQLLEFEYDRFGYESTGNKDAISLLLIPDYDVIIAGKDKKYTLIDSTGKMLCNPILDDVYMTINAGQKYYYMNYNNHIGESVTDYLDSLNVKTHKDGNEVEEIEEKNTVEEDEYIMEVQTPSQGNQQEEQEQSQRQEEEQSEE